MNKAELVSAIAERSGMKKTEVICVIDYFQGVVKDQAASGGEIRITGFFNMKVEHKPARSARNPATGKAITVPAKNKVLIKATKELQDAANGK